MLQITRGGKPLADFTQPIDMLTDCHRRIEHFLGALRKVVDQFGGGELPEEGRRALEKSLDYFRHAAPHHTADEEQSLFPRMRRSGDASARAALAELDRLEADHRRAEVLHQRVDELGRRWLQTGRLAESDRAALRTMLDDLAAMYAAHIRLEDERVFTLARQALNDAELRQIGREMQQRRAGH